MCNNRTLQSFAVLTSLVLLLNACSTPDVEQKLPSGSQSAAGKSGAADSTAAPGSDTGEPVTAAESLPAATGAENASDLLASFYEGKEDAASALKILEESGVKGMDDESRLVYAVLLRTEGRLDDSREILENILADNPDFAAAWFNLALVEHVTGRKEERDSALDASIKADKSYAEAYSFRGSLALSKSDTASAEINFKQALKYNPESIESLVGLAWLMAKSERAKQALPLLDKAVELEPDFVYARVDRSRVNVALRHYNAAEDDLDVAIENEPDVAWHYLDRARIRLRHFKDYDGALADLEIVETLDPQNFFALVYLAGLHDEERRFSKAKFYYEQVVAQRPDYIWAYMPMGKLTWMTGDYKESKNWYLKAAAEDPEEFSFILMAALASRRAGDEQDAGKLLTDVLRKFKQGEAAYEVIRFCIERSSDYYATNALNKEDDDTLRERLWFYMGAVYENSENKISANAVYTRLAPRRGEAEYDLAWVALNGMDGLDD